MDHLDRVHRIQPTIRARQVTGNPSLLRSSANALTAGNLLCGLWAVFLAAAGAGRLACGLVLAAGVLDLADGSLARWAGVNDSLGRQLDALADLVSFGVAPAVVLHTALIGQGALWSWVLVVLLPMSGMFRLARFAVSPRHDHHYRGLTISLAGITIALAHLCSYGGPAAALFSERLVILGLVVSMSVLMLAPVSYPTARTIVSRLRRSAWRSAAIAALVPALVLFPFRSLLLLAALYVAWPPLAAAARRLAHPGGRLVITATEEVEHILAERAWLGVSSEERSPRDTTFGGSLQSKQ